MSIWQLGIDKLTFKISWKFRNHPIMPSLHFSNTQRLAASKADNSSLTDGAAPS